MVFSSIWVTIVVLLNEASSTLQAPVRRPLTAEGSVNESQARQGSSSNSETVARRLIRLPGPPSSNTELLSELVNKRPEAGRGKASERPNKLEKFAQIFANHAKVQELDQHTKPLDVEALQEGWTKLRREEAGYYSTWKMQKAIEHHLRNVNKVSDEVVKAVHYHWQRDVYRQKTKKYRNQVSSGATPELAAKYKKLLQKVVTSKRESLARKRKGENPWPFEDYMAVYGIAKGASAKEIEKKSREFRHEYGALNSARATIALKEYLESNHYDTLEIQLALGTRREELKRGEKLRSAEKKAGIVQTQPSRQSTKGISEESSKRISSHTLTSRDAKIQKLLDVKQGWHSPSNL